MTLHILINLLLVLAGPFAVALPMAAVVRLAFPVGRRAGGTRYRLPTASLLARGLVAA